MVAAELREETRKAEEEERGGPRGPCCSRLEEQTLKGAWRSVRRFGPTLSLERGKDLPMGRARPVRATNGQEEVGPPGCQDEDRLVAVGPLGLPRWPEAHL